MVNSGPMATDDGEQPLLFEFRVGEMRVELASLVNLRRCAIVQTLMVAVVVVESEIVTPNQPAEQNVAYAGIDIFPLDRVRQKRSDEDIVIEHDSSIHTDADVGGGQNR